MLQGILIIGSLFSAIPLMMGSMLLSRERARSRT